MKIRSYKKEFILKVKQKFNDIQSSDKRDTNGVGKPRNDKERAQCHTAGMVVRK